ncbi:hypothetical protein TRFO_37673 [Tritrichomonas foetus]|uniref:Uncharacterized protein n=1 Tax=Tritrichomonas foetus TaxID=1144522 RepID=A0A1J4JG29_9EUKA|nr:hypothetical protein TRFO_37673 [Tritrichomonas foetus]|eukprot:OHS96156.1 hypothetical protein TRFO_37673 [Tritrichomonas foetus]
MGKMIDENTDIKLACDHLNHLIQLTNEYKQSEITKKILFTEIDQFNSFISISNDHFDNIDSDQKFLYYKSLTTYLFCCRSFQSYFRQSIQIPFYDYLAQIMTDENKRDIKYYFNSNKEPVKLCENVSLCEEFYVHIFYVKKYLSKFLKPHKYEFDLTCPDFGQKSYSLNPSNDLKRMCQMRIANRKSQEKQKSLDDSEIGGDLLQEKEYVKDLWNQIQQVENEKTEISKELDRNKGLIIHIEKNREIENENRKLKENIKKTEEKIKNYKTAIFDMLIPSITFFAKYDKYPKIPSPDFIKKHFAYVENSELNKSFNIPSQLQTFLVQMGKYRQTRK